MPDRFSGAAPCASRKFLLLAIGIGLCWAGSFSAGQASERRRTPEVKIVSAAKASVVNIRGRKTLSPADDGYHRDGSPQRVTGMGTGVVIDERGYLITNHHVVDGTRKVQVTLADKKTYSAALVAFDVHSDLAILKVDVPYRLPVIKMGTSSDLMPAETVLAIGNAYGYPHTVTRGIISELHRTVEVSDSQTYDDLIQTDASINPGNSGGPLLNLDGEMIGINVAVRAEAQGIGFAIPVDRALQIAGRLLRQERQRRYDTWHGADFTDKISDGKIQLVVKHVDAQCPAARSGLKPGDVVTQVGDVSTHRTLDLERALLGRDADEKIPFIVERNSEKMDLPFTLATRHVPRRRPANQVWQLIGLELEEVPTNHPPLVKTRYRGGMLVKRVRADSPAARRGIRRNDILVGMHIWETVSRENVNYILNRSEFKDIDSLKIFVVRGNVTLQGNLPVSLQR